MLRLVSLATAALALSACGIFSGSDSPIPTRGLVSRLPLDGDGHDAVGGNDATLRGPSPTTNRFGAPGRALDFDGVDDFAIASMPVGLDFDLRQDSYTVALWVRSEGMGGNARVIEKWDESNAPYPFSLQAGAAGLHGAVYDGVTPRIAQVTDLWDGTWHHVAVTFDAATGALSAYRDGDPVAATRVTLGASTLNQAPLVIGGTPAADRFFRGSLDDLLIYRRALTGREVRALARI